MSHYSEGSYVGQVVSHGFDAVGKDKTECLKIDFKVLGMLEGDEWVRTDETYVRGITCWFTKKSAARTIADLRKYAGWAGDDLGELNEDCLVGNQIRVNCVGTRDDFDEFEFPFEGAKRELGNSAVTKSIRNKFNKLAKAKGSPPSSNGKKQEASEPIEEQEEISF